MKTTKIIILLLIIISLLSFAILIQSPPDSLLRKIPQPNPVSKINSNDDNTNNLLNKSADTLIERYHPPNGYHVQDNAEDSFQYYLQHLPLKIYDSKVLYFNGKEKPKGNVYDSVVNIEIGNRDLHQCADAIMLLRGEYFYSTNQFDKINFNFVSGFNSSYSKWMDGYRIKVDGNSVTYVKTASPSNTYQEFRRYMDTVFAYASTLSLDRDLTPVNIMDMEIGDVFVKGGSPGHAIIVVNMAVNENKEKVFMLAQSYMPAQETQILINPNNRELSPWYELKEADLSTPEWQFTKNQLKRFP